MSCLSGFGTDAMFPNKLGIFRISKDCFEDANSIVPLVIFFNYDFSFFLLTDFDNQVLVTLEK